MEATGEVLIVDDNPNNLSVLGALLQEGGYRVRGATDGRQALKIAAMRAPDLILLDLQMPEMDGFEVCRRLKADAATKEIPVIVISAMDEVADKVRAFEAGAVDYVTKPFQAPEVLSRVGSHLQLSRLRRELLQKQAELEAQNRELEQKNAELALAQERTERVFSALAAALPGSLLDDKYRLDEKIGAGAFGIVFRAEQLALKRSVAVKVFRPFEAGDSAVALERFRREGVSACRINHPNAVAILDSGISKTGIAYLVMELLEGKSLAEALWKAPPLPVARCAAIGAAVCSALAEAHAAGLVHRDIKPDNVFLHQSARGEVVKVLDFGIAKLLSEDDAAPQLVAPQLTRGLVGTPAYIAPERLTGEDYDGRADVYSIGVMLYQMLAGRLPFPATRDKALAIALASVTQQATPLASLVTDLPEALGHVVMRALDKEPARRPSAREIADQLSVFR